MSHDPMKEWVLRDEILAAFHRWPVIVLFSLAGALVGLVAAYVWPAPYRAKVELSVQLNPYRALDDQYLPAFTGAEFRNVDDYKHWQMLQLSILVMSDPYLSETLERLRKKDPYWDEVDQQQLREMLAAEWRNAGVWLLSADADDQTRAQNAVEVWRDVIVDLTQETVASSQELFELELKMRAVNDQIVKNQLQKALLEESSTLLEDYRRELEDQDQGGKVLDQFHQELFTLATHISEVSPDGGQVLVNFPNAGSPAADYQAWMDEVAHYVEEETRLVQTRLDRLDEELTSLSSEWQASLEEGQGLAATLTVKGQDGIEPEINQIRSYGLAVLIGTLVGLLIWFLVFLVQVTRRGYQ